MGSANSTQHRETHQVLRGKLRELASIVRDLGDDAIAASLEDLSRSSDLSTDDLSLAFRRGLAEVSPTRSKSISTRERTLSDYFGQLGRLEAKQIGRLVSLVECWELERKDAIRYVEQESPLWEKDHKLFWRGCTQSRVPSAVTARLTHLVHEIDGSDIASAIRRRLLLIIINDIIESETDILSTKIRQLALLEGKILNAEVQSSKNPNKRRRMSQRQDREAQHVKECELLEREIASYPEGVSARLRVIGKLSIDLWSTGKLPEAEIKERRADFAKYSRWGKKYSELPLGTIALLGTKCSTVYERGCWSELDFKAMTSYWQEFSGTYKLCERLAPLMEAIKGEYWEALSADLNKQEDASRLPLESTNVGYGGGQPENITVISTCPPSITADGNSVLEPRQAPVEQYVPDISTIIEDRDTDEAAQNFLLGLSATDSTTPDNSAFQSTQLYNLDSELPGLDFEETWSHFPGWAYGMDLMV